MPCKLYHQGKKPNDKYKLYEEAGVREYWIVNPADSLLHVFRLADDKFRLDATYAAEDSVKIGIFDDITIDLKNVFEAELPNSPDEPA